MKLEHKKLLNMWFASWQNYNHPEFTTVKIYWLATWSAVTMKYTIGNHLGNPGATKWIEFGEVSTIIEFQEKINQLKYH